MEDYSKKIKAVFFDVDGTLLSHKINDVPLSTQIALQKLRSLTGNPYHYCDRKKYDRILPASGWKLGF